MAWEIDKYGMVSAVDKPKGRHWPTPLLALEVAGIEATVFDRPMRTELVYSSEEVARNDMKVEGMVPSARVAQYDVTRVEGVIHYRPLHGADARAQGYNARVDREGSRPFHVAYLSTNLGGVFFLADTKRELVADLMNAAFVLYGSEGKTLHDAVEEMQRNGVRVNMAVVQSDAPQAAFAKAAVIQSSGYGEKRPASFHVSATENALLGDVAADLKASWGARDIYSLEDLAHEAVEKGTFTVEMSAENIGIKAVKKLAAKIEQQNAALAEIFKEMDDLGIID